MTSDSTETPQVPTERKPRRWRRRLLIAVGAVLLVLVLLVVLLPTILTSGFAERKVSAIAEDKLGRPVTIEGLAFGWRTPLTLEHAALPAIAGEQSRPALDVRGVRVPLTLWGVLRDRKALPLSGIEIASIEVNVVRLEDGQWNVLKMMQALKGDAPPTPEEPEATPSGTPSPLPIKDLSASIARIDLRVIDASQELEAGWEDGSFSVLWPGGAQPLTSDVAGTFRVNAVELPWDVRAKISHWIDADNLLTPMAAEATVTSDGMNGAHQIADGGFYVHATAVEDAENTVRLVLPLEHAEAFAHAASLPVDIPPFGGEIDWTVGWTQRAAFRQWTLETSLKGTGLRATLPSVDVPAQDARIEASASVDLDARVANAVRAEGALAGITFDARATRIPFDNPFATEGVALQAAVDLTQATSLASQVRGGTGAPIATGSIAFEAMQRDLHEDGGTIEATLTMAPGELMTLRPFVAQDPEFLLEVPMDLTPLHLETHATISAGIASKSARLVIDRWENPIVTRLECDVSGTGDTMSGGGTLAGSIDLAHPLEAWGPRFRKEAMPAVQGALDFDIEASADGAKKFASEGALALRGFSVAFVDKPEPLALPETTLAWDLSVNNETPSVVVRRIALENDFAVWTLDGSMTDAFDIRTHAEADLGPIMELASLFKEMPVAVTGKPVLDASLHGTAGDRLDIALGVETAANLTVVKEGTLSLDAPVFLDSACTVAWSNDVLSSMTMTIADFSLGEAFGMTDETEVALGETIVSTSRAAATVRYAPILAMLDPALLEQFDAAVALEGETTVEPVIHFVLQKTAEGIIFPEPVEIEGTAVTEIAALEWAFREMSGYVEGFFDEREFAFTVDPADPKGFAYEDQGFTGAELVSGPMGLELGAWQVGAAQAFAMTGARVELAGLELSSLRWQSGEMAIQLPRTAVSGNLDFAMEPMAVKVGQLEVQLGNSLHAASDMAYSADDRRWSTRTSMELGDVAEPLGWTTLPAAMREAIPALEGSLRLEADLAGTLPGEDFDPTTSPLPVAGTFAASANDIGLRMPVLVMEKLNATIEGNIDGATRSGDVTASVAIDRAWNPGLTLKAARDMTLKAEAAFTDADSVRGSIGELRIRNYGTLAEGTFAVSGIMDALASAETNPIAKWLGNLDIDASARAEQDLLWLSGIHPSLLLDGQLDATFEMTNRPERGLTLDAAMEIADGELIFADMVEASGISGSWQTRKTLAARNVVMEHKDLPPGEFRVVQASFGPPGRPGLKARTSNVLLRLHGFDEPVRAELEIRDLMSGNAVARTALNLVETDPVLSGDLQVAGVDAGQLAGLATRDKREWEINGAGSANWRLRDLGFQRVLEDLSLRMDSTRIGRLALTRLLEALDAEQDDPRFQNARAALRFGTPTMAQARLNNSLVTFGSELRMPGGVTLSLPILERQPLGDMIEVYDFDRFSPMFSLTRTGLLVLLAEDLAELEQILATLEANQ
ncbi:MAG: hypothetical protein PWP23_1742 [Candidatus Sumerlaeota bacterium]|nr:hypothetical protein [Candidatus Sumerlaeota bacterium]